MPALIVPSSLSIPPLPPLASPGVSTPSAGAFQSVFSEAVSKVEGLQQNAQASVDRFLNGEGEELHHLALTSQQAELSFQLFMQVRNKVVAAYQQVMQMQV